MNNSNLESFQKLSQQNMEKALNPLLPRHVADRRRLMIAEECSSAQAPSPTANFGAFFHSLCSQSYTVQC
jgi:hypothetical protein